MAQLCLCLYDGGIPLQPVLKNTPLLMWDAYVTDKHVVLWGHFCISQGLNEAVTD